MLYREAEDRSRIYMLLSTFYLQRPNEEFIRRFRLLLRHPSSESTNIIRDAISNDNEMIEGFKTFELFLNLIKDIPEAEVIDSLAVDWTRLFRGIKEGYGPPPPYESVWRGEGRIMGEWTQKVLEMYRFADIGMDIGDELPDYIGIELKFMARLCYEESVMWRENNPSGARRFLEMERDFLKGHIRAWVPAFISQAIEDTETGFYKAALELTHAFLELDEWHIDSQLGARREGIGNE
ncbi:MAG: molecular chaperone TorD family protein [Thermodesulfovibrionia bacterium]